ncbi:MAG: ABC transporter permease [Acidobacteria bacterium]|nr:ABC transporter permease [Acidobacteriota bacterium]
MNFADATASEPNPEQLPGELLTSGMLRILDSRTQLGRWFTEDEERAGEDVVVLSHRLWQRRYGGSRDVIGRRVTLNGQPAAIIGVSRSGFIFRDSVIDFWLPMKGHSESDLNRFVSIAGRIRSGLRPADAQAQLAHVRATMQSHDSTGALVDIRVELLRDALARSIRNALPILQSIPALILARPHYSSRNAIVGSTCAIRRAGR